MEQWIDIKWCDAECFLGLEISRYTDGGVHICQSGYAKRILQRFHMVDCNPVSTPSNELQSSKINCDTSETLFPYREVVGSLMYLAVGTRPDICFALNNASRYMENPSNQNIKALKRILRYVKGTIYYGIHFKSNLNNNFSLFNDADFAGDPDTRKSTSGYVFMMSSGAVSWSSEKQRSVALSTTESEYIAAAQAVKQLIWLRQLLEDISPRSLRESPTLYVDNQSAIKLIKNPEYHKRTKHIDVRYHFIRDKFEDGSFSLSYIGTDEQLGDIFTKNLPKEKFEFFRGAIGIHPKIK